MYLLPCKIHCVQKVQHYYVTCSFFFFLFWLRILHQCSTSGHSVIPRGVTLSQKHYFCTHNPQPLLRMSLLMWRHSMSSYRSEICSEVSWSLYWTTTSGQSYIFQALAGCINAGPWLCPLVVQQRSCQLLPNSVHPWSLKEVSAVRTAVLFMTVGSSLVKAVELKQK